MQQIQEITSQYELLASYGTNGLTEEHKQAIKELKELEEIIFFFDGDEAGRTGAAARANELKEIIQGVQISYVETPEGEDINSLSIGHEAGIFTELLQNRKPFFFSTELKFFQMKQPLKRAFNLLHENYTRSDLQSKVIPCM